MKCNPFQFLLALAASVQGATAFVAAPLATFIPSTVSSCSSCSSTTTTTALKMVPMDQLANSATCAANSFFTTIATIDSDIASISDNEFRPVFIGGLVVMFGGLISALFVGLIVDNRNLYANLVADSYAQAGDQDEEFWKGLSDEEKKKAQEILAKIKQQNNNNNNNNAGGDASLSSASETLKSANPNEDSNKPTVAVQKTKESKKETSNVGMFSDYGDDA